MRPPAHRVATYVTACAATLALASTPAFADVTTSVSEPAAAPASAAPAGSGESDPAAESAATSPTSGDHAPVSASEGKTIRLLGITDFHGHIARVEGKDGKVSEPGAVALACEVAKVRSQDPDALFVSAGDNVGGSAYVSSILRDEPTMTVLNQIGLAVSAAGNHEFDQGVSDLAGRIVGKMDAPVLSANVTGNAALTAEGDGDGVVVKDVDGVKVGFVGVTTDELPTLTSTAGLKGLTIANATATANARAAALKDGRADNGEADVVVVLAHEDAAIFGQQFSGDVDAVVAGHTHVPYAQKVRTTAGTEIPVVQPDHYGLKLGDISLTVARGTDGKARVTASQASNIDLAASDCAAVDATEPYGVAATVAQAQKQAEEAGNQVLATLGSDYLRGTDSGTDTGANRSTESTASDLIADSFRDWLVTDIQPAGEHYIGLMNPGGVRADYGQGELTQGEAYQVQPFGNEIAYATYTGKQVKQVLAEQFQPTTSRAALILGVSSNVQVVLDQQAADTLEQAWDQIKNQGVDAATLEGQIADAASRVVSAVYVDGEPLADDAKVVIASNSFLLGGGDSFTTLKDSPMVNTGILDRDITAKFLAGRSVEENTASYTKRQTGREVTLAPDARSATVRLTGLSFSAAAEQSVRDAAAYVTAVVTLVDGSEKTIATSGALDRTVSAQLPETGQATLTFGLPEGVRTDACTARAGQCAAVRLRVANVDGTQAFLPGAIELAVPADAVAPAGDATATASASEGAATPTAGNGSSGALARTGAELSLVVVAAGLVAGGTVLLLRRRRA